MGELADMAIDGECCQICFAHFQNPPLGYPYTCPECQAETSASSSRRRNSDRIPCPNCGRMITRVGMAQHCEAKHPELDDETT